MEYLSGSTTNNARRAQPGLAPAPGLTYATMMTGRGVPKRSYADNDMNQALMSSYGPQTSDQAVSGSSTASSGVVNSRRHHQLRAMSSIVDDHLEMNSAIQPPRPKRRRDSPSLTLGLGPLCECHS